MQSILEKKPITLITPKEIEENDFLKRVEEGQTNRVNGLSTGKLQIDKAINLIQPGQSIAVAASNKVGKSKWTREHFILGPYLKEVVERRDKGLEPRNITGFYYSLESSLDEVLADCCSYLIKHFYDVIIEKELILGRKVDDQGHKILLTEEQKQLVKIITSDHLVPLFGSYKNGKKVKDGIWHIITDSENPTGIWKELMAYADKIGKIIREDYEVKTDNNQILKKKRITGFEYKEKKFVLVIIDDVRLLSKERGFSQKENIDKWCEYTINLCEVFKFTIINIVHTNRKEGELEALKYYGEKYFPTENDTKDSGNIGERMKIMFTLFNPIMYNIKIHFNKRVESYGGRYRSVHLVLSRDTPAPQHFQTEFFGNHSSFNYI